MAMPKKKTQELMKTLEKEKKLRRARTKKGRFVADDPSTPHNEAYVPKEPKTYEDHIREATAKASKKKDNLIVAFFKTLKSILFGKN
tara:strand:+ start:176 stop:436 length:261 start_codon:yes stop_codon:yes gene_type:complete